MIAITKVILKREDTGITKTNINLQEKGGGKTVFLQRGSLGFTDAVRQCEKVFPWNIDKFVGENEIKAKVTGKLKGLQFCKLDVCPEENYEIVTLYVKSRLNYFALLNRNIKKWRIKTSF